MLYAHTHTHTHAHTHAHAHTQRELDIWYIKSLHSRFEISVLSPTKKGWEKRNIGNSEG